MKGFRSKVQVVRGRYTQSCSRERGLARRHQASATFDGNLTCSSYAGCGAQRGGNKYARLILKAFPKSWNLRRQDRKG